MIKTLIFDLGGVIVPLDFPRAYEALAPLCGLPMEEIPQRIRATGLVPKLERGQVSPQDFHHRICDALNLRLGFAEFCELWSAIFPPRTLLPESLLESLHARYGLLLLSNTNAIHFPFIRKHYPLLRHFDAFVVSHEVGLMKPDPAIYRAAVQRAGCLSGECLFIDDIEENVTAARAEGIDAVHFESLDQLTSDLRRRGIEV